MQLLNSYMRTRFDYDITASVLDEHGKELATKSAKGSGAITNFLTAGSEALGAALNSDEIIAAISPEAKPATPAVSPSTSEVPPSYDQCMRRVTKISDPGLRISSMAMCDGIK